jgi:hypothetical protein
MPGVMDQSAKLGPCEPARRADVGVPVHWQGTTPRHDRDPTRLGKLRQVGPSAKHRAACLCDLY